VPGTWKIEIVIKLTLDKNENEKQIPFKNEKQIILA